MKGKLWGILVLAFFLSVLCCMTAVADGSGSCGANVTWTLSGGTLTISGTGPMTDFGGANKPGWDEQRNQIQKIVIRNGVTYIGENAFKECSAATEVAIPESVTVLGRYAFENCSGLEYVAIPESMVTICDHAFTGCSGLTSIRIPANVSSIEVGVFYQCSSLYAIYVSPDNQNYSAVDGVLCNKDETALLVFPAGKTGVYTTPEHVTVIEGSAFSNCDNLTGVILRDGVTEINGYAFYNCRGLTSIEMPDSLIYISSFAFWSCSNDLTVICNGGCYAAQWALEEEYNLRLLDMTIQDGVLTSYTGYADAVIIPEILGVTAIGDYAFENAGIRVLVLPTGVTSIGEGAFRSSSLEQVNLPSSLTSIGNSAFMGCVNLKSANIPEGVTDIEFMTFYYCAALESISIADTVTSISDSAFEGCPSLATVYCKAGTYAASWAQDRGYMIVTPDDLDTSDFILPDDLEEIGTEAFAGLPMRGVTCQDNLERIGARAFADCENLRVIVIPYYVRYIAANAFSGCPGGLVIIGSPGSSAAEFAQAYGYTFISR